MVLGVLRIGVGFARRIEGEAGGLGHRDHLLLANVAGLVAVGHVGCGAMLDHAEHAAWLEHVEEAAEHAFGLAAGAPVRSEEHTSELQSLMRISYAVFCLKKKNKK